MATHRYHPTHLKPQHRRDLNKWDSKVTYAMISFTVAAICMIVVLFASGVFGQKNSTWSDNEREQISRLRTASIEPQIMIKGEKGEHKATKKDKTQWLDPVNKPESVSFWQSRNIPKPKFNLSRIQKWVQEQAYLENNPPVAQEEENYADGTFKRLAILGKPGNEVSNVQQLSKNILEAMEKGKDFFGQFTFATIAPGTKITTTTQVLKPFYAAKPGQRWIEVDLTNNTTSAWQGDKLVYGPTPSVAGHHLAPTVRGVFAVYHKIDQQTMRGVGFDGPYEETAPWIMYFHGDFALHAAPWRTNFHYSPDKGSHGCVNLPTNAAKWFYDWSPIGTTVVVHD